MKVMVGIFLAMMLFIGNIYGRSLFINMIDYQQETLYAVWNYSVVSSAYKPYKDTPYWKRYKVLQALGWTSVGIGISTACCTALLEVVAHGARVGDIGIAGKTVIGIGLGLAVASVPLFICAHYNKKKALAFSIGPQGMAVPSLDGVGLHYRPGLAMRICF